MTGATMIEILVTLVILAIGLLGIAALHSRMTVAEVEGYQRAQALILLNDMASRLAANRNDAANYVTATPLGVGMTCPTTSTTSTTQQVDTAAWCNALQGASETLSGNKAGAMVGARGCIQQLNSQSYMVTVAWQGVAPVSAPPASVTCAAGSYDMSSTSCVNDLCRRTVSTLVQFTAL